MLFRSWDQFLVNFYDGSFQYWSLNRSDKGSGWVAAATGDTYEPKVAGASLIGATQADVAAAFGADYAALDMAGMDIYTAVASYLNRDLSNEAGVSKTIGDLVAQGRLGVVVVMVVATVIGMVWLARELSDPAALPIRRVMVEGEFKHLTTEHVQRAVVGAVHAGFFGVDVTDRDALKWLTDEAPVESAYDTPLFRALKAFHTHNGALKF